MNQSHLPLILIFKLLFFYVFSLFALPTVTPDPIRCVENLELNFFDVILVSEALSLYKIRQELWLPIAQRLKSKNRDVPFLMKKKTAYMVPNPIEYPMQREMTAKILKEVLYEVFEENMAYYGINQQPRARFIFDYIFTQQMPLFIRCFGENTTELQPVFD